MDSGMSSGKLNLIQNRNRKANFKDDLGKGKLHQADGSKVKDSKSMKNGTDIGMRWQKRPFGNPLLT